MPTPRILAVLPTYRRRHLLASTLLEVCGQTRPPDLLLVVDNEASAETEALVSSLPRTHQTTHIDYLAAPENLGSAGGWALGMNELLADAHDEDWILPLDDDDPPHGRSEIARVYRFATRARQQIPRLAAAGIVGARFHWKKGRLIRPTDLELDGTVVVDYVGSGHLPMYSAGVMKKEGVFRGDLFFGLTEVEYCLRLRAAGYSIVCDGNLWKERRRTAGRLGLRPARSWTCTVSWRHYYTTRNYVFIMAQHRRLDLALKRALVQVVLKPLLTAPAAPKRALRCMILGARALHDGLRGRMGRVVEPGREV